MRGQLKHVVVSLSAVSLVTAFNVVPSVLTSADSLAEVDPAVADLADDIDQILADPRMDGSQAAVLVTDADTGEVLYDHNSENRLMPASNQKMFTAAAALDILGPEHAWTTTVEATAAPRGSVLRGDLYLRGGGDATMLEEDLQSLARQIADAGIRTVTGDLVADDRYFDDVRLGPDWNWDDEPFYYAAQVSGLNLAPDTDYDAGTVIVRINAGENIGDPGVITVTPETDYVTIVNQTETTEPGTGRSLSVTRQHGSNDIVVRGRIAPDGGTGTAWSSVWEPTGYVADVFANALADAGVRLIGDVRVGTAPAGATVLAEHTSMTLAEMLIPFMKLSNNGHAEVLVKTIGREVSGSGTWSAGIAAIRSQVDGFDVDVSQLVQRDGSGLSRRNFVAPAEISALLDGVQDKAWFEEFYTSLPVAGVSDRFVGGTLRSRMVGTPAEGNAAAKTGSLTGATALSGYVTTADGDDLIFSIVMNNYLSAKPADLEDAIVVRLASHGGDVDTGAGISTFSTPESAIELPDGAGELVGHVECSWVKAC
jgi:D-alanyl-D-alanine carboxypeptidase/D-alanyl-D-alanine-endopeptidase (penicillin-binding protein 4)